MSTHSTTADYVPDPNRWKVLGVLVIVLFMSLIGVSIVNVALPSIQHGIGATQAQLQWVLSGYALTFGIGLVAAGRAGDVYGRGPLFILGVVVFTASSVWAGFAPDAVWLNIARAFQGAGSALINPQAVGMIQQYFRGAERARAFGIFGSVVGVSVAIGPLLGGFLIELGGTQLGWRWTFLVNLPVGIIAVILAFLWMPRPLFQRRQRHTATSTKKAGQLDPVGAGLLGLAVLAIMLPFMEGRVAPLLWAALPLGALLVWAWVKWERQYKLRGHTPMVDLAIFRTPSFANGTLMVSLYFLGMTSIWVIVALYMQEGLGRSALEAGLVGLPSALLSAVAALYGGRKVVRHGRMVVIIGIWFSIAGLILSALVVWLRSLDLVSEWWLVLTLSFIGVAQGMVISPNQALTLAEVPLEYAGSSGGVMQTGQRIGASVGIAAITAVAFHTLALSNWSVAFIVGFGVILVVIVLALVVAYRDLLMRKSTFGRVVL